MSQNNKSSTALVIIVTFFTLIVAVSAFVGNKWLVLKNADWQALWNNPQQLINALKGDADAQYETAKYYSGQSNFKNAAAWFRKAADQNHGKAQNRLAIAYLEGKGVEQNFESACDYFERAYKSMKDIPNAANAGMCLDEKLNAYNGAASYYKIAATGGDAQSKFKLARLYWRGAGVPQDYALAVYWFRDAAIKHNDALAMASLSRMYLFGQGVSRRDPIAAYLLLKTAQEKANAEDRAILEKSQIDQNFLAKMENDLPPKLQQARAIMDNMAKNMSVAEIFAEIDKHTPYKPPVLPE